MDKRITRILLFLLIISFLVLLFTTAVFALKSADVDGNGVVNSQDIRLILENWLVKVSSIFDIDENLKVNSLDLGYVIKDFGKVFSTPTPYPTSPPSSTEWTQFGHDAQRTNFTSQTVATPWRLKWQWNASNPDGEKQASHLPVPKGVQPITGGGRIYLAVKDGSSEQLYSFDKNDGRIIWQQSGLGRVVTTPAYDNGNLYVTSSNGVYRLDAATKAIKNSMTNLGAFKMSPLLVSDKNRLYVANDSGVLYAIDLNSWQTVWSYHGGAPAATPPSYSPSTGLVIYATHDLYVHAVRESTGLSGWEGKKKPTSRSPYNGVYSSSDQYWPNPNEGPSDGPSSSQASFEYSWPVIAEGHGLVFVRIRLDSESRFGMSPFPKTNELIRDFLQDSPNQALFAFNLNDGNQSFTPAVGNGGEGDGVLHMGPMPVIAQAPKSSGGFDEVAYIIWRNGQTCGGCSTPGPCPPPNGQWCDGREDATMGEMVLDSTHVISGCANSSSTNCEAGDIRFVRYEDIQTDEMMNLTMSETTLFHSHWLVNAAYTINNRSFSLGETFSNPIQTNQAPYVIWRQCCCGSSPCLFSTCPPGSTHPCSSNCSFSASHYCSGGLESYADTRLYPAGFYEYFNDDDNFNTVDWPDEPFTVVSDGLIIVLARDGGLMVLENGTP